MMNELIANLTEKVSAVTENYLSYDGEHNDRRVWTVEDISDRWAVEIPFRLDGVTPMTLRAVWFGRNDNCILHFEDVPTTEGVSHLAKWLKAMLELDF